MTNTDIFGMWNRLYKHICINRYNIKPYKQYQKLCNSNTVIHVVKQKHSTVSTNELAEILFTLNLLN